MTSKNKYSGIVSNGEKIRPSTSSVSDRSNKRLGYSTGKKARLATSNSKKRSSLALKVRSVAQKTRNSIADRKKTAVLVLGLSIVLLAGVTYWIQRDHEDGSEAIIPEEVQKEEFPQESPQFELVFPSGRQESDYEVVRSNPEGKEISYTYLDWFRDGDPIFRVTQQQIPKDFNLARVAEGFQATQVIQVNETMVYHGYSERGGIQYLIFEKNDLLVLIRSPQRFSDDTWASYVASMD